MSRTVSSTIVTKKEANNHQETGLPRDLYPCRSITLIPARSVRMHYPDSPRPLSGGYRFCSRQRSMRSLASPTTNSSTPGLNGPCHPK